MIDEHTLRNNLQEYELSLDDYTDPSQHREVKGIIATLAYVLEIGPKHIIIPLPGRPVLDIDAMGAEGGPEIQATINAARSPHELDSEPPKDGHIFP